MFTTLHSNDAPRTIERLVELGVARPSLAAGLTGVLAQRLIRRLCEGCRQLVEVPADLRQSLGLEQNQWWIAGSCRACAQTGYSGRIGVFELLVIDDELRDAIGNGASSVTIARSAASTGYRPMFFDGLAKVAAGQTSYAELSRVVGRQPN